MKLIKQSEVRYRLEAPEDGVIIVADRVREHGEGIRAELRCFDLLGRELHFSSVNLLSHTWRKPLAQSLSGKLVAPWAELLDQLASSVVRELRRPPEPVQLQSLEAPSEEDDYALYPIVPLRSPVVLYGDGGAGKSLLSLALAVMASTGARILPGVRLCTEPHAVLYLDWEDDPLEQRRRLSRLVKPHGVSAERLWYMRVYHPLDALIDDIEAQVRERNIQTIIIDSLGMAAGSDPWSDDAVLGVYRALRRLSCSAILVAHVAKADLRDSKAPSRPYGTVYVRNAARSAWQVDQGRDPLEDRSFAMLVRQQKSNRGARHSPLAWKVSSSAGSVQFDLIDWQGLAQAGLQDTMSRKEWLLTILRAHHQPLTTTEISRHLAASPQATTRLLERLEATGQVTKIVQNGKEVSWGLRAPAALEVPQWDVPWE